MLVESAAERYASALFELAREGGRVQEVDEEIRRAAEVARTQAILTRALAAPDIPEHVKRNIVQSVYGPLVSPLTLNFLQVLVEGQRFTSLPHVANRYHGLMQDAQGQVQADIETAVELPDDVKRQVEAEVSRHTGRVPLVRWHVDPEILGGVVVRIKDNLIDYSLKSQLHDLRKRLLRAQA